MDVSAVSSAAIRGEVDAGRVVLNGQVPMAARDDLPDRAGAVAELAGGIWPLCRLLATAAPPHGQSGAVTLSRATAEM
eukprot:460829-Lingulodinium_polyedra.AAC.1